MDEVEVSEQLTRKQGRRGTNGDVWGRLGTYGDVWGRMGTYGDMGTLRCVIAFVCCMHFYPTFPFKIGHKIPFKNINNV